MAKIVQVNLGSVRGWLLKFMPSTSLFLETPAGGRAISHRVRSRRSEVEFELQHEITRRLELLGAAQLAVTAEGVHELVAGDFRPRAPLPLLAVGPRRPP